LNNVLLLVSKQDFCSSPFRHSPRTCEWDNVENENVSRRHISNIARLANLVCHSWSVCCISVRPRFQYNSLCDRPSTLASWCRAPTWASDISLALSFDNFCIILLGRRHWQEEHLNARECKQSCEHEGRAVTTKLWNPQRFGGLFQKFSLTNEFVIANFLLVILLKANETKARHTQNRILCFTHIKSYFVLFSSGIPSHFFPLYQYNYQTIRSNLLM